MFSRCMVVFICLMSKIGLDTLCMSLVYELDVANILVVSGTADTWLRLGTDHGLV